MTKAEVVAEISRTTGLEKSAVLTTIEKFMEVVKESLSEGENVYLRGFGSFVLRVRKEKVARNMSKNTAVIVPAHRVPFFKPSQSFIDDVWLEGEDLEG